MLPSLHLTSKCYPFLYAGIDTCGPLMVGRQKYYVLLIVDLVCTAIILEVLKDMTTKELLLAFQSFVAC